MIDELQVSNIALIREATLVPSAGLTVLTGETGAGKTALLSALKLILGGRADSSTVREGEALASVEARLFDGPHDTEGFTVQRSLSAEGRSRVKIDGRIASVRELSERVGVMMDLCGQHEHQRLLDPAHHVAMVDAWAGRSALEALMLVQNNKRLKIAQPQTDSLRLSGLGVRLIAINDGVDSLKGDDDFTPFRNIMNEFYARDTSRIFVATRSDPRRA